MSKEIISSKQGVVLVLLYTIGDTLLVLTGLEAKKDAWVAVLLALVFGIILMWLYGSILEKFPERNIYEISQMALGRLGGKIICIIYIWFSIHLGALVLRTLIEFINTLGLESTPALIPGAAFIILCAWAVKEGIEVIGRWAEIFLIWFIFTFIILLALSITIFDITKLQPIFYDGFRPLLRGAFSAFAFPFGELVIFLMVFDSLDKKASPRKVLITGITIAGLYISYIAARNIAILGVNMALNGYFPTYSAISRINIGNFFQRLEIAVSLVFLIGIFIKISLCILAASKGVSKLFNVKDYRFIVVPVSLLVFNLSSFVYENIIEMTKAPSKIWPYYSFPFEVLIPFLILVLLKIKNKSDNTQK